MCYYFIPYSIAQLLFHKLFSHSPTQLDPKSPVPIISSLSDIPNIELSS